MQQHLVKNASRCVRLSFTAPVMCFSTDKKQKETLYALVNITQQRQKPSHPSAKNINRVSEIKNIHFGWAIA
jgi:hypothetical protein